MQEVLSRCFANGVVYALKTDDEFPVEVTDTYLPNYTKDAIKENQNLLKNYKVGNRNNRWMIGVSCMSGCPVGCKFCATGQLKRWRNLSSQEIVEQVMFIVGKNPDYNPNDSFEFKINYTRMGEPFLNLDAVKEAIQIINSHFPNTHHYISTIGLKGLDFSWIKDNITLQISLHSLDERRRHELIPISNLMTIEELGQIRTQSKLKTTVNLTLIDYQDFNIDKLKKYFDPEKFFIKLSPINPNPTSKQNKMGLGIVDKINLV